MKSNNSILKDKIYEWKHTLDQLDDIRIIGIQLWLEKPSFIYIYGRLAFYEKTLQISIEQITATFTYPVELSIQMDSTRAV